MRPAAPPRIRWCGDGAFAIELGDAIDEAVSRRVMALDARLATELGADIVETVPTYRSLLVHVDPIATDPQVLAHRALALAETTPAACTRGRRIRIPVVYGGAFGPDLDDLVTRLRLTPDEVVLRHSSSRYRVHMIGFMPGFAYLGGLDPTLATPRKAEPRALTPAGSISIGGVQAAVAAGAAPSAWHLLGRTPARLFMPGRDPPFLLEAGDEVVFERIDEAAWERLDTAAAAGDPVVEVAAA